jgi:hypothetical protein
MAVMVQFILPCYATLFFFSSPLVWSLFARQL